MDMSSWHVTWLCTGTYISGTIRRKFKCDYGVLRGYVTLQLDGKKNTSEDRADKPATQTEPS